MPKPDVLQSLKLEADELEAKLEAIRRVIALYDGAVPPTPSPPRYRRRVRYERSDPILDAAAELLGDGTIPMRTKLLLRRLNRRGIDVPGKVPQNTLSARLSNSPRFHSHGRSGWTKADPSHPETPDDDSSEASDVGQDSSLANRLLT